MRHKTFIAKYIIAGLVVVLSAAGRSATAQAPFGPSDPSVAYECGAYQWPLVQSPCPEVQIKQKHDHTPLKQYRAQGWDTVVTCSQRTLELSCMPYLPVQYFNGQYTVDTIPYDPPDPTFARGTKMPVSTDDDFAASPTEIPFSFFFYGIQKNAFVLGANGLITFNTASAGKYCPWKFSAPLPWGSESTNGAPKGIGTTVANMRDAIYGIYEDTHPIASYLHGDQGIYYGVQDEEPCRKIICSWNGIPTFPGSRNQQNRCTYQIVCYEGSNIIEVHVKRRGTNSQWQGGRGLLGIQNATGTLQSSGGVGTPNMYVQNGSPAAFYPTGSNLLTTTLDSVAFRFTPQGNTMAMSKWYRLMDNDSLVELTTDVYDTNGYYVPMGQVMSTCPTLTRAVVTPTRTSRYVFHTRFMDAAEHWYFLYDTIVVGMDTANSINIRPSGMAADVHQLDICASADAKLMIEYPELQDTSQLLINITRIRDGVETPLPDSLLTLGALYTDEETRLKTIPSILRQDETARNLRPGQIDSIHIQLIADFISGCHNTADMLVRIFPAYDTTEHHGICQGETFTWAVNGQSYTASTTTPQVNIPTSVGCDSVVHLNLHVSDVSYTIDEQHACKPYTWLNGVTYTESNTATALTDTMILVNQWGCDSTLQLDFTLTPMTPVIASDREYFDYDNLDVVLTDISTGGSTRVWHLPGGQTREVPSFTYTVSPNVDTAHIMMVEYSLYGCIDTAYLDLPFRHNVIWVPNVFVPTDDESGNGTFHSVSRHLTKQQTYIYDRRGIVVFQCEGIDCQWDGRDLNGNPCPQGGYVYVIRYVTEYDPATTHLLKGAVTLLR